ncbi:IQ and AAA domain-containing protein 1-like [Condylostylus longicornis]|uniref:IQ and AAA domain-containing protein 1-like n=1 Tax=Condylostylus longicornis TaxID=2530218 RepID=UPI00244D9D16|nr:IQ and AAA domain-containing protein 1-like [Condylostylus longicornis]
MSAYAQKYKFWVATKEQLENVIIKQKILQNSEPIDDRSTAHSIHADMYCDYVDLVNKLDYIYHRTFQVQKRELLQRLLEAATSRLCELRNELKEIELSEYIYIDKTLVQRKLTYDVIQLIRPDFLPFVRDKEIYDLVRNSRQKSENKFRLSDEDGKTVKSEEQLLNDASLLIQAHESLRVSRILQTNIKYDRKEDLTKIDVSMLDDNKYEFTHRPDQKIAPGDGVSVDLSKRQEKFTEIKVFNTEKIQNEHLSILTSINVEETKENAARIIQRAWISFLAKKSYQKQQEKRAIIYGIISERKPTKNPLENILHKSYEFKTIRDQYVLEFVKAVENERSRVLVKRKDSIMEDISDHIRHWIHDFYEKTHELPPFPSELKGGTILVLQDQVISPEEFNEKKTKTKEQLAAEVKKIRNEDKKQKQKLKEKIKQQEMQEKILLKKIAEEGKVYYNFGKIFTGNKLKVLEYGLNEINDKWHYDVNEKLNYKEDPFMTWISEEKFAEIHMELRKIVDQTMRLEYETLRKAIAIDRKKKYKPPKQTNPKKPKRRKTIKVEIDPTENLSVQELFYQMESSGLIRNYKKRCFEEFFGDFNYCAYHLKNLLGLEAMPSTLEVRDILREFILGMGPLNIPKYKSILIGGPPKSGKVQLCEILASEIDAVMIDLSIENVSKYENDIDMLIHLVQKMSRILQPTIIFIENVHRTFCKKIPPEFEHLSPLILSKYLKNKIIKNIKQTDKIIILATSDEPWTASRKMNKIFDKILLMPKTDYSSAYQLWRKFILQNSGVPRNLEFSPIAWVLRDYTSGEIADNVNETLNINRRMKLIRKPLKLEEFLETFLQENKFPAKEDVYKKYYKWYEKANKLERKRKQVAKILK